jgi:hypothetical protein
VIFVAEGKTDRYFYSKVFGPLCDAQGLKCKVHIARELPGRSGGKKALLRYHDYLRRKNSLCSVLGEKKTVVIFLLDKDIDDRIRKTRKSAYTIYTDGYDYESYLFRYGNIVEGGAAAAELDVMSVQAAIGDQAQWLRRASNTWRDWVKVCVFSVTRRISAGGNYGVCPSPINQPPLGPVDIVAYQNKLQLLERASGRSRTSFRRSWNRVSRDVDLLYADGEEHQVFKGKWYSWFLADELRMAAGGRDANTGSLEKRIAHHLALTVDYSGAWATQFRNKAAAVLAQCGLVA